jgi:arylsulfatase A-like enzyme
MSGFDEWFATEYSVPTWNPGQDASANPYYHNDQLAKENLEGCDSRVMMDRAIPFIRKAVADQQPFLAVIWFHAPHEPVVAGPEFRRLYAEREEGEQHFFGAITALDLQMGRLRRELRELGVAENTMLWFTSDNGPEGDTGDKSTQRGSAGPFRGRKRSLWEGGIRVPGLLEWPARIAPGSVTAVPCSTLDYYPTTLDVLGLVPDGQPEPRDGVSLVSLFDGKMQERPVPIPFETLGGTDSKASRGSPRMALVDNRFKLLTDMEADDEPLLFDLLVDPGESTNLAQQFPDRVATMKNVLVDFRESCKLSLAGRNYSEAFAPDADDTHPAASGARIKRKKQQFLN